MKIKGSKAKSDQYKLRFPGELREHLKALASISGRSLNAEIVFRLSQSLAPHGDPQAHLGPTKQPEPNVAIDQNSVVFRAVDSLGGAAFSLDECGSMLRTVFIALSNPRIEETYGPEDCLSTLEFATDRLMATADRLRKETDEFWVETKLAERIANG